MIQFICTPLIQQRLFEQRVFIHELLLPLALAVDYLASKPQSIRKLPLLPTAFIASTADHTTCIGYSRSSVPIEEDLPLVSKEIHFVPSSDLDLFDSLPN